MPSTAREARIAALEAELSALRGDSRRKVHYDHNEPLEDPYAHTGVDPWGGWRSGWKSPTRPRVRFGVSWSVRENIEPAAVERSGRCEPSGRHVKGDKEMNNMICKTELEWLRAKWMQLHAFTRPSEADMERFTAPELTAEEIKDRAFEDLDDLIEYVRPVEA